MADVTVDVDGVVTAVDDDDAAGNDDAADVDVDVAWAWALLSKASRLEKCGVCDDEDDEKEDEEEVDVVAATRGLVCEGSDSTDPAAPCPSDTLPCAVTAVTASSASAT